MFSPGLFNSGLVGTLIAVPPQAAPTASQSGGTPSAHSESSQPLLDDNKSGRGTKSLRTIVNKIRSSRESDHSSCKSLQSRTDAANSLSASEYSSQSLALENANGDFQDGLRHEDNLIGGRKFTVKPTVEEHVHPHQQCPPSSANIHAVTDTHSETDTTQKEEELSSTEDCASPLQDMVESFQHRRGDSFHVNWTAQDLPRLAREVYDETIADVHLSLFAYWIREEVGHYELAKQHVRELALDQGYKVDRIRNLKLRRLLQETYSVRPGVPGADSSEDEVDSDGEPTGEAQPRMRASQWLKETLQHLETPLKRNAIRKKSLDVLLLHPSPKTSSSGINMDKQRAVSSPLIARFDKQPASLRAQRMRILKDAATASVEDLSRSPSGRYPPNTPDRPAPLSVKSSSSNSINGSGTPSTHVPSPLTASALESLNLLESMERSLDKAATETVDDIDTKFNEVIRRSISSPRAKYRFASAPTLRTPTHSLYQIIDKGDGDVFGIDGEGSVESDTATEIYQPQGRLSTIFETTSPRASQPITQHSINRLSDADWQTEVSIEEQNEALLSKRRVREDYEQFLIDAHEDPHGEYGINSEHSGGEFVLDPEDESDNEGASPFDTPFSSLSSYVSSNGAESVLETASDASDETPSNSPTVQYAYTSRSRNSLTQHSNQSTVAVDFYRPLPLRHYEDQSHGAAPVHPAFRKEYRHDNDMTTPNPAAPERESNTESTFFESYFKQMTEGQPSTSASPAPASATTDASNGPPSSGAKSRSHGLPSQARTSPTEPPPALPSKSPLRERKGPSLKKHKSRIPIPKMKPDFSADGTPSKDCYDAHIPDNRSPVPVFSTKEKDKTPSTHSLTPQNTTTKSPTPAPGTHTPPLIPPPHPDTLTPRAIIPTSSLPVFERTWRTVHRDLLIRLFGRADVQLSPEDVEFVEQQVAGRAMEIQTEL
ncbi:hypothetical protein NX059_009328 [Plenodomus lindquistii]|nr:hypothetical protein NX059_009328 [Plenodomus lindquistii]